MSPRRCNGSNSSQSTSGNVGTGNRTCGEGDILVVEDNPGDIHFFELVLADLDYDVTYITEGREALCLLDQIRQDETTAPALVFLDLNLPEVHGFDILKRIKSTDGLRSIPVVICSGSLDEDDMGRAYELGANGYLPKPMAPEEHLQSLETLVGFWL
jgi:CheY-like chemotaxis protein